MGNEKKKAPDGTPASSEGPSQSPDHIAGADTQRSLETARIIRDAAARLERSPPMNEPEQAGDICRNLRQLAAALEARPDRELPEAVVKLAEMCVDIAAKASPHEHKAHQTATHHTPLAPGGLGYIMTLSEEEEKEIDWGSEPTSEP